MGSNPIGDTNLNQLLTLMCHHRANNLKKFQKIGLGTIQIVDLDDFVGVEPPEGTGPDTAGTVSAVLVGPGAP
jgi:hypothetical protein